MTKRYIAQRVLTGEFLDYDVPIVTNGGETQLSGVGGLSGTITPDIGRLRMDDGRLLLDEWGTYLYEEEDGQIRWGGIVITSQFAGPEWKVEAANFSTFPHGTIYSQEFGPVAAIDALTMFRNIWDNVQAQPDSDLGIEVVGTATTGHSLGTEADPYALAWWDAPDCGAELDTITTEGRFDWLERHYWSGDTIRHEIQVGYPRLGRRQPNLTFVQGENVASVIEPDKNGDDYANNILGVGAGEGKGSLRRGSGRPGTGRLRRTAVVTAKNVKTPQRLDSLMAAELQRRLDTVSIEQFTVIDHPNAPFGSWSVGDDIMLSATLPWLGDFSLLVRVVSMQPTGPTSMALTVERSDSFTYGG